MTKKNNRGGGEPLPQIDTAALLSRVDIVEIIDARVKLSKSGAEFEACCPFHNEATPSFKVSPSKQFYHCFGCGAHGDAISFLVEHDGLSFVDACRELGADVPEHLPSDSKREGRAPAQPTGTGETPAAGHGEAPPGATDTEAPAAEKKDVTDWKPVLPVPDEAPPRPVAHIKRGKPSRVWTYRDGAGRLLGYVARFEKSTGGKEVLPLTYCRHAVTGAFDWRWISFPEPRPLYGLERLAAMPDAFVIVVEGEKCVDALQAEIPDRVVVSWPGGGKAVAKADFSPLAGRNAAGWADCDAKRVRLSPAEAKLGIDALSKPLLPAEKQPGVMAMQEIGERVLSLGGRWWDMRIPAPGEQADGWDVADAIAEGLHGEAMAEYIRANLVERHLSPPAESTSTPKNAGADEEKKRPFVPGLIFKNGDLAVCMANVYQILAHRAEWRGVIAFDLFALRVVKRKPPPYEGGTIGDWSDIDDARSAMWLAREYGSMGFTPGSSMVSEAIQVIGRANEWHPVRDWLRSMTWDGVKRLSFWMEDFLGVERSEYSMLVAKWWLMGAVKRVLVPGCKFDYCLVLEGPQGKGKSTVLAIIGGEWYSDTDLDFTNKDSMVALGGKLVYELAELGALARSDERRQKSFLSRQVDEYRPHYGRSQIKAPRQLVFGGSTNEWEWNKDPTGGRRFWPIACDGELNLDGLREVRDQLFAEAYHYVLAGERYWPTAEEQKRLFDPEQLRVEQPDAIIDAIHDWVYAQVCDFSLAEAAFDGLKLDASKLTRDVQTRIGTALRKLGCERVEKRNGMTRFWYKPPTRNGAKSKAEQPAQPQKPGEEGVHVPF